MEQSTISQAMKICTSKFLRNKNKYRNFKSLIRSNRKQNKKQIRLKIGNDK